MTDSRPFHYSELSTLRHCPQKHHYAYVEGLRANKEALNLKRGLWLHSMLQADALKRGLEHGSLLVVPRTLDVPGIETPVRLTVVDDCTGFLELYDEDDTVEFRFPLGWKGMLQILEEHSDYAMLPDHVIEERYTQGGQDLPTACRNIMRGYLWQYRAVLPKRKPLLVETEWARTLETGDHSPVEMEGRGDLVEIDERGIVTLVDWKSTKSIPGQEFKLMESQRYIYAFGMEPILAEHGITIAALAFDYLVTSTPTKPKQNQPKKPPKTKSKCKDCNGTGVLVDNGDEAADMPCSACEGEGKRLNMPTPNELKGDLSKAQINTTPLVYFEAIKEYGLEMTDEFRATLDELERDNSFFARFQLPMSKKVLVTILEETAAAAQHADQFRRGELKPYRNVTRMCDYMCDFQELCMAELYGQDTRTLRERDFELRTDKVDESICGETWTTQKGVEDVCSKDPEHAGNHRGRIAEWAS